MIPEVFKYAAIITKYTAVLNTKGYLKDIPYSVIRDHMMKFVEEWTSVPDEVREQQIISILRESKGQIRDEECEEVRKRVYKMNEDKEIENRKN